MTELKYLSVETIEGWATRAQDAAATADTILVELQHDAIQRFDHGLATALQAAMLQLAEARVFQRVMLDECATARRIEKKMEELNASRG